MPSPEDVIDVALGAGAGARRELAQRGHDLAAHEGLVRRLEEAVAGLLAAREFRAAGVRVAWPLADVGRWQAYVAEVQAALAADPPTRAPQPPRLTSRALYADLLRARHERVGALAR